jgi:hypothetical protein
MGWLFTHQTHSQLIASLIQPRSDEAVSLEVLEHQLVKNVLWSLVRVTAKKPGWNKLEAGESFFFIRCDLLDHSNDGWGYKAMEESVHPYYYSCPLPYLDLAPEQSADWRAGVRQFHADEAQNGVARLLSGTRNS